MHTPYYEIDEAVLQATITLLKTAMSESWGENVVASYSVKSNSLPWLLNYFRENNLWAEVVSSEEYDLSVRLGYHPSRIIHNGPIKDETVVRTILENGGIVNLDSAQEIEWLEQMDPALEDGVILNVGLRININHHSLFPYESIDEEESRFGYCEENGELEKVILRIQKLRHFRIAGLHLHSASQTRSLNVYRSIAEYACELAERYHLNDISYIDMGGGYYGGIPGKPDFRDYAAVISASLRKHFDPFKVTLIMEPGVSLISSAFSFVTTVKDVKTIRGRHYVIVDGSRLNLNPKATRRWYYHHYVYGELSEDKPEGSSISVNMFDRTIQGRKRIPSQILCGSSCMEDDRFYEEKDFYELKTGDLVIFERVGAYTICMCPLFIHYFPAVVVKRIDGSVFVAREPWTNEELLRKNHIS